VISSSQSGTQHFITLALKSLQAQSSQAFEFNFCPAGSLGLVTASLECDVMNNIDKEMNFVPP